MRRAEPSVRLSRTEAARRPGLPLPPGRTVRGAPTTGRPGPRPGFRPRSGRAPGRIPMNSPPAQPRRPSAGREPRGPARETLGKRPIRRRRGRASLAQAESSREHRGRGRTRGVSVRSRCRVLTASDRLPALSTVRKWKTRAVSPRRASEYDAFSFAQSNRHSASAGATHSGTPAEPPRLAAAAFKSSRAVACKPARAAAYARCQYPHAEAGSRVTRRWAYNRARALNTQGAEPH